MGGSAVKRSQNDIILDMLMRGDVVSPVTALNRAGCFRLAARIFDLRAAGNTIHESRHPDGYACYFMVPEVFAEPERLLSWRPQA